MAKGLPEKTCCRETMLASILLFGRHFPDVGHIQIVQTPFPKVARLTYKLVKQVSDSQVLWEQAQEKCLQKRKIYRILIPETESMNDFLSRWGFDGNFNKNNLRKACCKRAFLKGAFLGSGSVSDPRAYYHFEIISPSKDLSRILVRILKRMEIEGKITTRRNQWLVYVKRADDISNILNILGAYRGLLEFEEVRAIKETKEEIHRRVNCETANLDKTGKAAVRQLINIRYLNEKGVLEKLPKGLREIADLRIRFQEANLRELGERLSPPISKSSVNSRFRRLEALAAKLRKE
ncbi:MAG: DNA-binding protein WhiA [Candidatus Eremiobacteraeota bacterium]|nr:DNA-binding protein WhiA [Candidatus Eremiobacteraeota bacterium]